MNCTFSLGKPSNINCLESHRWKLNSIGRERERLSTGTGYQMLSMKRKPNKGICLHWAERNSRYTKKKKKWLGNSEISIPKREGGVDRRQYKHYWLLSFDGVKSNVYYWTTKKWRDSEANWNGLEIE